MKPRECAWCKKTFTPDKSIRIYCSMKCYGDAKSEKLKGSRPKYMKGFIKGYTPANTGRKKPPNVTCHTCGVGFRCKPSHSSKYCSKKCWNDRIATHMDKTVRKIRQDVRRLVACEEWRQRVLKRDGGRCCRCGSNQRVEVDHFPKTLDALVRETGIKRSVEAMEHSQFWDVANGRILCRNCHAKEITSTNYKVAIRNTSVCVTGGAGMIGSHLVDELLSRGNKVLVLDNLSAGARENVSANAEFVWYDVRDEIEVMTRMLKERNVKYLFHLVSLPYIPNCFSDPVPFFQVNASGTMNTLMACQEAGVRKVLMYSSAEIYGTKDKPIKERDVLSPQSTYGVAKFAADQLAKCRFVEAGVPVVINRQFNVYSWRARHPYVIPEIIKQLSAGPTVRLGNIYSWRDFLYIDDAVNMAIELLEKGIPGEEYNIGVENCIRIDDLAKMIGGIIGHKDIQIVVDEARLRPWDIARLQADTTKLRNTISYRPTHSLEEGLRKVVDKYKENGLKWEYEHVA